MTLLSRGLMEVGVTRIHVGAVFGLAGVAVTLLSACGSSSNVSSASCSACVGTAYTADDCQRFAAAAGCHAASFNGHPASGCLSECTFTDCDSPPECSPVFTPQDASVDAPQDPRCAGADGLFPNCDLCPDSCDPVTINGATQYTCRCGSCPCGFECGGIPLSVGGTIGSVCAPPPM